MQVFVEIDPSFAGFGQQGALHERSRIDQSQIELLLVALHALIS